MGVGLVDAERRQVPVVRLAQDVGAAGVDGDGAGGEGAEGLRVVRHSARYVGNLGEMEKTRTLSKGLFCATK